jgi:hypothetical protein
MRSAIGVLILPFFAAACAAGANAGVTDLAPADVPPAMEAVIPGTIFAVQLDQPIGGPVSPAAGSTVTATVTEPLVSPAGLVVIPAGARVEGLINGHQPAVGAVPGMIDVEFNSVVVNGESHRFTGWVVHVDMAITDDGATLPTGIASVADLAGLFPGTVVSDAEVYLHENELGPEPNSVISLGWERGATLPAGARLTVEFAKPTST